MKVILTIGISASGKTTWANEFIKNSKIDDEIWLNINQDDIRLSIIQERKPNADLALSLKEWDYNPNGESEGLVRSRWDMLVKKAIKNNITGVIISDTNLTGLDIKIEKLKNFGIRNEDISYQVFEISLEEAIKRNKQREFQVDEKIIAIQFEKFNNYLSATKKKNKIGL